MYNIICIIVGERGIFMECPFLTTLDEEIKCFKECALYEYKNNEGICPFKELEDNKVSIEKDFDNIDDAAINEGLDFIRENYKFTTEQYL